MQRKKNMSERGVQVTFIFNIVKSISKKDIVVFWHVHVMSPPKPRLIKMSIGQWYFSEFPLPLLLKPKWRAKISFVAHAMLLRYCRIARLLLFAHGILLQRLRMVHHIATKWKLFCNVAEMFYVGWVTTLHTNTACKISE